MGNRHVVRLGLLFGALYFIQGFADPTEGLIAQPVRTILRGWRASTAQIAGFTALLAIPWTLKPFYGLVSDFVPIGGSRRRSYLVLAGLAAVVGFAVILLLPPRQGQFARFLGWLLLPTIAVAVTDVVADALLVETAQPRGLTGTLLAVQWGALYAATVLTGSLGGYLSEHRIESMGFAICAILAAASAGIAMMWVREDHRAPVRTDPRAVWAELKRAAGTPGLAKVAAFLFLWNFNPFSNSVLHLHMTTAMGFSEQLYGHSVSVLALASVAACLAYGLYCRRVPLRLLIHVSIMFGIVSTLAYAVMESAASVMAITVAVGFTYMTATLIQLDLAARVCPVSVAGTVFATLMALENLAVSLSTAFGGAIYEWAELRWDAPTSFFVLLALGALTTAACWLIVPAIPRKDASPLDRPDDLVLDQDRPVRHDGAVGER
jgi:predicted MFS family arabinose efflux permease